MLIAGLHDVKVAADVKGAPPRGFERALSAILPGAGNSLTARVHFAHGAVVLPLARKRGPLPARSHQLPSAHRLPCGSGRYQDEGGRLPATQRCLGRLEGDPREGPEPESKRLIRTSFCSAANVMPGEAVGRVAAWTGKGTRIPSCPKAAGSGWGAPRSKKPPSGGKREDEVTKTPIGRGIRGPTRSRSRRPGRH